jgi:hypothetical protein
MDMVRVLKNALPSRCVSNDDDSCNSGVGSLSPIVVKLNLNKETIDKAKKDDTDFEQQYLSYSPNIIMPSGYDEMSYGIYSKPELITKKQQSDDKDVEYGSIENDELYNVSDKSSSNGLKLEDVSLPTGKLRSGYVNSKDEGGNKICMWCIHPFHTDVVSIPTTYKTNTKIEGNGVYCSFQCACASLLDNSPSSSTWHSLSLMNMLYNNSGGKDRVTPAPPRAALKMFGGSMDIEDFRSQNGATIVMNLKTLMTAKRPKLAEVNNLYKENQAFVPINIKHVQKIEQAIKKQQLTKGSIMEQMNINIDLEEGGANYVW